MIVDNFPDRTITIDGSTYLYFGGTGYLGLSTQPDFQDILVESIQKWGTFYGNSRSSNIKLGIYTQFEDTFAKQIGSEAVLTVSSGTLAGRLVLDFLAKDSPAFFHYPKTHPAILAKNSLPLFVDGKLHESLRDDTPEDTVITTDAILGLEVEPVSYHFLDAISASKKITLVVDESHSLGVLGADGRGVFATLDHKNIHKKIMVSSLGKALSLSGGIIAGNQKCIAAIKQIDTFVSSSAANPAYLELYYKATTIYETQKKKLQHNLHFIADRLVVKNNYKFNKNYPVIYSEDDEISDVLYKEGIITTNFKYPTYKKMMNRIVITANHKQEDLELLLHILNTKNSNNN